MPPTPRTSVTNRKRGAVPREQHRTTRELPLRLADAVQSSRVERQLGLKYPVRPGDGDEVGAWRPAQSDRHWLQALTRARLETRGVEGRPSRRGAHGDARTEAGDVRAALVALRIAPGESKAKIGVATRPRVPDHRHTVLLHANHRRPGCRIKVSDRPAHRRVGAVPARHVSNSNAPSPSVSAMASRDAASSTSCDCAAPVAAATFRWHRDAIARCRACRRCRAPPRRRHRNLRRRARMRERRRASRPCHRGGIPTRVRSGRRHAAAKP